MQEKSLRLEMKGARLVYKELVKNIDKYCIIKQYGANMDVKMSVSRERGRLGSVGSGWRAARRSP